MLAEAFLHFTGASTRLGRIEDGNGRCADFEEEEVRRGDIPLDRDVLPVEQYRDSQDQYIGRPRIQRFHRRDGLCLARGRRALVLIDSVSGAEVGHRAGLELL